MSSATLCPLVWEALPVARPLSLLSWLFLQLSEPQPLEPPCQAWERRVSGCPGSHTPLATLMMVMTSWSID